MAEQQIKAKARRKLNRGQIIDILERNVELYKEEDLFVHYLVELAIYLMEYEYNWDGSDVEMPSLPERPEGPRPQIAKKENKVIVSMLTPTSQRSNLRHFCPFCGTEVGELLICPSCRNLTR
jgi:hypothetical protein